ncbi:hypothetical protein BASA81_007839 [Batrachochytrium salamandrivorans]|nr:hypothetical protein BASA81_007839 [Batrachochytrium salamandrivorans]
MKPALPHERFSSREAEALARAVGLNTYLTLSMARQNLVLERTLTYVQSNVGDGEIVCMFRNANEVLPELFESIKSDRFPLLLNVVGALRYPVLDRFDSRVLIPFLMRLCSYQSVLPVHIKTALAALQYLAKGDAMEIWNLFEERNFLETLGGFITNPLDRVQQFSLQIVYNLSAHAALGDRLYANLDKLRLLSGPKTENMRTQLVGILCNLCTHASAAARGEVVFPLVLDLIHALPNQVKEMEVKQLEGFVVLLRLVCKDNANRLQKVFDLCFDCGWFVCFGQLIENDETLALMQDFSMLVLCPRRYAALQPLIAALQAKLARENKAKQDAYWTVLCLLHFDRAGVPSCKLPTALHYESHGKTAVVSLRSLLHPEPGKNIVGCKLSESLSSISLVMKHLGKSGGSAQIVSKLCGKGSEESLESLLNQALEMAKRQKDVTASEWAEQCLHAIGCTSNKEKPSKLVKQQQPEDEVETEEDEIVATTIVVTPTTAMDITTQEEPEEDEEVVISQVLFGLRQYLVDFDCYREMTAHAFLEMGLSSQQYFTFSRWLTKEDAALLFDDRFVASLPISLDEKKALCLHRAGLLTRPESEWAGLGLSSLCRSRITSLTVKKQRERFDYALRFRW